MKKLFDRTPKKPSDTEPNRREFLGFAGIGAAVLTVGLSGCAGRRQQEPAVRYSAPEPRSGYTAIEDLDGVIMAMNGSVPLMPDFDPDHIAEKIRDNTLDSLDVGHALSMLFLVAQAGETSAITTMGEDLTGLSVLSFERLGQTLTEVYDGLSRGERRVLNNTYTRITERIERIVQKLENHEIDLELRALFCGADNMVPLNNLILDRFREDIGSGTQLTDANRELITNHYWMATSMIYLLIGNEPSLPNAVGVEVITNAANNIRLGDPDISHRIFRSSGNQIQGDSNGVNQEESTGGMDQRAACEQRHRIAQQIMDEFKDTPEGRRLFREYSVDAERERVLVDMIRQQIENGEDRNEILDALPHLIEDGTSVRCDISCDSTCNQ
ncbi:twin-arginine translocation signal domain-containing protein [Candidatus Micrarchaeota archaeon]|nr:twin-arginine translocation signal domain-containing protein [Candidatus Micrarchaeota archaeon]